MKRLLVHTVAVCALTSCLSARAQMPETKKGWVVRGCFTEAVKISLPLSGGIYRIVPDCVDLTEPVVSKVECEIKITTEVQTHLSGMILKCVPVK